MRNLFWIAYFAVGVYIAGVDRNYFEGVNTLDEVVTAVFAVAFWPLLVLGIDVTLH